MSMVTMDAPRLGVVTTSRGQFPIGEPVRLVSVAIAAERSGIDANHLRRLIRDGSVPYRTHNGMYCIDERHLPIDLTRYRKKSDFRKYVGSLIEDGDLLHVVDDPVDRYILTEYAANATLAGIAEQVEKMTDGERVITRQRVHQIIKEYVAVYEADMQR